MILFYFHNLQNNRDKVRETNNSVDIHPSQLSLKSPSKQIEKAFEVKTRTA